MKMTWMNVRRPRSVRRFSTGAALVGLLVAAPAIAQEIADCQVVGTIGVTGWSCVNCAMTWDGETYSGRFGTEPRVNRVDPRGPAAGILEPGDRIVAVDGVLITQPEGGRRLIDVDPGQRVVLRYRRGARESEALITAGERCAPDAPAAPEPPRVVVPPSPAIAPRANSTPRASATPDAPEPTAIPTAPLAPSPPAPTPMIFGVEPDGTVGGLDARHPLARLWNRNRRMAPPLGFSLECEECAAWVRHEDGETWWTFESPPVVEAIQRGSAAERAGMRAGDRLVEIDGLSFTSEEGGRHFANLSHGEEIELEALRFDERLTFRMRLPEASDAVPPEAPSVVSTVPEAYDLSTLRYVGELGETDIEVRGRPVIVRETDGSIVIRADGIEVRLRVRGEGEGAL